MSLAVLHISKPTASVTKDDATQRDIEWSNVIRCRGQIASLYPFESSKLQRPLATAMSAELLG